MGTLRQAAQAVIDVATEGQPLVRLSVLGAENLCKARAAKQAKIKSIEMQGDLF